VFRAKTKKKFEGREFKMRKWSRENIASKKNFPVTLWRVRETNVWNMSKSLSSLKQYFFRDLTTFSFQVYFFSEASCVMFPLFTIRYICTWLIWSNYINVSGLCTIFYHQTFLHMQLWYFVWENMCSFFVGVIVPVQ